MAGSSRKKNKAIPLFQYLKKSYPEFEDKGLYARILCGEVRVDGGVVKDPKYNVSSDSYIQLNAKVYVSRGGEKLNKALKDFQLDVSGKVFIDAGSSTGGFSHCLLLNGARTIHSVDVGYNQLDYSLRKDPRIIVHERTNVMDLGGLAPEPDAAVADLSFRSIQGAASHLLSLTSEKWLVALIKPQFEWVNPPGSFDGVVRATGDIRKILHNVVSGLDSEGVFLTKAARSPIFGRKGNQEFFFFLELKKGPDTIKLVDSLF